MVAQRIPTPLVGVQILGGMPVFNLPIAQWLVHPAFNRTIGVRSSLGRPIWTCSSEAERLIVNQRVGISKLPMSSKSLA